MNFFNTLVLLFFLFISPDFTFALEAGIPGKTPIPIVEMMENHGEAYLSWRTHRQNQRIVVHFDAHSDIGFISPKHVETINIASWRHDVEALKGLIDFQVRQGHPISIANFLYAALKDDTAKKIYWVIPDPKIDEGLGREIFSQLAFALAPELPLFKEASAKGVKASIADKEVIVTTIEMLPVIEEAVLLDIDVDFFFWPSIHEATFFQHGYGFHEQFWMTPSAFLERIAPKIQTDHVTISRSVNGFYVPFEQSWIADEIYERLRLNSDTFPKYESLHEALRLYRSGDLFSAKKHLQKNSQIFSDDPFHLLNLALIQKKLREPDFFGYIDKAIVLNARFFYAYLILGNEALQIQNWEMATAFFEPISKRPASEEIQREVAYRWYSEGLRLVKNHRLEQAILAFQYAIKCWPKSESVYTDLGNALVELNRDQEALQAFSQALHISPDDAPTLYAIGNLYARAGKWQESIAAYEKAIQSKPYDAKIFNNLGQAYAKIGQKEKAKSAFEQAIAISPSHYRAYGNLGLLYFEEKAYPKARDMFQNVLSLSPEDPLAKEYLQKLNDME